MKMRQLTYNSKVVQALNNIRDNDKKKYNFLMSQMTKTSKPSKVKNTISLCKCIFNCFCSRK